MQSRLWLWQPRDLNWASHPFPVLGSVLTLRQFMSWKSHSSPVSDEVSVRSVGYA